MAYRLLQAFEGLFAGVRYRHRRSNLGDIVASHLYDDLFDLGKSPKFVQRVQTGASVLNVRNTTTGIRARRGDGTFGVIVPSVAAVGVDGFEVRRGPIASVEIGAESKVLAKAMIKQIDRVVGDLARQVEAFRTSDSRAITVAIVGVNHADRYASYEGRRTFRTDGTSGYRHPAQEAADAERRLLAEAAPLFDHFVLLRFRATNERPYPFEWVDAKRAEAEYASVLVRLSRDYERRF